MVGERRPFPGCGGAWRSGAGCGARRYDWNVTSPDERPASVRPVSYKGAPLDSERGPGLGCFRFQVVVLATLILLTPLSVGWEWPAAVSALLLFAVLLLLLLTGQTIIFLLRLVAADRRDGRRRPLAGQSPTVGELEDEARAARADSPKDDEPAADSGVRE